MKVTREIVVSVGLDGSAVARRDDGVVATGRTSFEGVDEALVRVFERWLAARPVGWLRDDVRAFGSLLHRVLFPPPVWSLVERTAAALAAAERVRLRLAFPDALGYRHLAAVPWEYLYRPDRSGAQGAFLATDDRFVLSRQIPSTGQPVRTPTAEPVKLLLAVAQPSDLPDVGAGPVQNSVRQLASDGWADVSVVDAPLTPEALAEWVKGVSPDVVHLVGHGRFDEREDVGKVALLEVDDTAQWLTGEEFGQVLTDGGNGPRLVVLQSCLGAKENPSVSFAGTAPQMIRNGVPCVVAMQYAVTPDVASAFAAEFYAAAATGMAVDEAAQRGRRVLAGPQAGYQDPRLIGVPVVYARKAQNALQPLRSERAAS